jgi:hypothetical protein
VVRELPDREDVNEVEEQLDRPDLGDAFIAPTQQTVPSLSIVTNRS